MSISPEVMNWLVSISLLSGCLYATWLIHQTNKKPHNAPNYKNISQMAQNLTSCKVSTIVFQYVTISISIHSLCASFMQC